MEIQISPDKLTASITIDSKPSNFPDKMEILKSLQEAGVVFGIDSEKVHEICAAGETVENSIVARGLAPEPGQDGQLIWHVDKDLSGDKVAFDESGLANYKQARDFCEVSEGDEIVSRLPKVSGKPGKAVTGETLISHEKDVELPSGDNVRVSEDGLTLFATKSGFINYHDGRLEISNIFRVDGDVSFNSGNVKYDGQVVISGDVRSGFRVEATDSIIIEGDVEAAEIRSKHGDVIVKMGILGKGRGKIVAGNNVVCGFIQDAEIKANNNVIAERYIINSDVYAGNKIIVNENEGLIRGGKVFGEKGIEAKEAGSIKNIKTKMGMGVSKDPEKESLLIQLVKEEDKLYNRYELISKKERFLKLLLERVGKLSEEKNKELTDISEELITIKKRIDEIDQKRKELSSTECDISRKNKIVVTEKLHKGVLINAGSQEFFIDKLYEKVMVYQDLDNIIIDDLINEQE